MYFDITEKTGFLPTDKGVVIYKYNFKGFFEKFYETKEFEFNLPIGLYFTDFPNSLIVLENPVYFKKAILPNIEHLHSFDPEKTELFLNENINKASIFIQKNVLSFDKDLFYNLDDSDIVFVILHEHGHKFYNTESFCDRYAQNMMINLGYNPSQINNSGVKLFGENYERLKDVLENTKKWINE